MAEANTSLGGNGKPPNSIGVAAGSPRDPENADQSPQPRARATPINEDKPTGAHVTARRRGSCNLCHWIMLGAMFLVFVGIFFLARLSH